MARNRNRVIEDIEVEEKIHKLKKMTPWVVLGALIFSESLFVALIVYAIMKMRRDHLQKQADRYDYVPPKSQTKISRTKKDEINLYLYDYFKANHEYTVSNECAIRCEGSYTNFDDCTIVYKNEVVGTIKDFYRYFPQGYRDLVDQLLSAANGGHASFSMDRKGVYVNPGQRTAPVQPTKKETKKENKCQQFISHINSLNNDIPNEQITNGLYMTSSMLTQIDNIVAKFPETEEKLTKMYNYYLPTLVSILSQYRDLQTSNHSAEELADAENKLNKTVVLINEALRTLTGTLTQEQFMDLNANMSTLENVLKSDGLVEEGTLQSVARGGK